MGLGGSSGGGVALSEGVLEEFVVEQVVVCQRRHLKVGLLGIVRAVGRFFAGFQNHLCYLLSFLV